jgi:hypothetical protein
VDGAIVGLFDALLTLRDEGRNITKLLVSVEMLAQVRMRSMHACSMPRTPRAGWRSMAARDA